MWYNEEKKGGGGVKAWARWEALMAALILLQLFLLCPAAGEQEDWSAYIVVEDQDELPPDPALQARMLARMMTDREKIYQLFLVSPEQLTGESRTASLGRDNVLKERPVGGVILFGQNIESEDQLRQLTASFQAQARQAGLYPLFIAVNEAGGNVSRVAGKLGYAPAEAPDALGARADEAGARAAGAYIASYLSPLGVNLDFAPVADTRLDGSSPGDLSYSDDPMIASRLCQAMAEGLREGGVIPCLLHFPGQGSKEGTTLSALSVRRTAEEMRTAEWIPFRDGIQGGIGMIQVSHAYMRSLGETIPASLSPQVVEGFLRRELGFSGVIATDSLRMAAVTKDYKPGSAAVSALLAGADLLVLPADLDAAAQGIQNAVKLGQLSMDRIEESVARILALKIQSGLIQ